MSDLMFVDSLGGPAELGSGGAATQDGFCRPWLEPTPRNPGLVPQVGGGVVPLVGGLVPWGGGVVPAAQRGIPTIWPKLANCFRAFHREGEA